MKTIQLLGLVTLTFASPTQAQANGGLLEQMLPPEIILPNAASIGLDDMQSGKLRDGLAPLQNEMRPLRAQMQEAERELVALLAIPKPDEAAVLKKFAELDALESQVKIIRLKMTLLAKSLLNTAQQETTVALKAEQPAIPGDGDRLRDKLMRVRDGLARWKKEGRDPSEVMRHWEQYQQFSERRWYQQAIRALDDALKILEAPQK